VGFMHSGHLLAFDSPHKLKAHYLKGATWSLDADPLLEAVHALGELDGVAQARLQGDRAQAIVTEGSWTPESLTTELEHKSVTVHSIEPVEPTLEDVFTLLAHQGSNGVSE
jgi:ABC-type multidrug transport system ATPase subunit